MITMTRHDEMAGAGPLPELAELDRRLLDGVARGELLAVFFDHDAPTGGACPTCGWVTSRARPACPSRVLARAVREYKPAPGWLLHLVDAVPGAIRPSERLSLAEQRAAEDAAPGLFEPPVRRTA